MCGFGAERKACSSATMIIIECRLADVYGECLWHFISVNVVVCVFFVSVKCTFIVGANV